MGLIEELAKLQNEHDDNGVLTIYLNIDSLPNGEWKIRLKNGLKKLEEYVKASGTDEEVKTFKKIRQQASIKILDQQLHFQKSFVLFGSACGFWYEKHLQVPMETAFHWEKRPVLHQLNALKNKFPAIGILLVQKRDAVFIDTALGEIRDEATFSQLESGLASIDAAQSEHENQQRWYKELAPLVDREVVQRSLQGLYLVGSKKEVKLIEPHLRSTIIEKIPKNLFSRPAHLVLNEVYGNQA